MLALLLIQTLIWASSYAYKNVCYEDLGCFTTAPPWGNTQQRPFDILPDEPAKVKTRFYLDTRYRTDVEVYYDDMNYLATTAFDPSRYTRFIIHGYIDNGDVQWLSDMSSAFLSQGNENIIRIGWMGGSLQVNYMSSAVDTQIVGASVANMINNMISTFGMTASQFHCVGHSLGAQTCGYVGSRVSKLDRISGLDAAGPYFEFTEAEVRLDVTDAEFVDVIHSDAEALQDVGFGTAEPSGDVDFWPNNGRQQPGCDQNALSTIIGINGVVDGTRDFVACNHIRAVKFYIESITTTCFFKSYPCLSYGEFLAGKCLDCDGTGCPKMGYRAIESKGQVSRSQTFLSTNALSPFCEYMSDVGIQLGSSSKSMDGSLYLTLYGSKGSTAQERVGEENEVYALRAGGYYSSLVYYGDNPGEVEYVKILWILEEIEIGRSFITVDYITVWAGATQELLYFCGDQNIEMKEKTRYTLLRC